MGASFGRFFKSQKKIILKKEKSIKPSILVNPKPVIRNEIQSY